MRTSCAAPRLSGRNQCRLARNPRLTALYGLWPGRVIAFVDALLGNCKNFAVRIISDEHVSGQGGRGDLQRFVELNWEMDAFDHDIATRSARDAVFDQV